MTLERVAQVPAICLHQPGLTAIDLDADDLTGARGHAVLIRTDHSRHWGTDAYFGEHPHLTARAAEALVAAGVACVELDSLNIDAIDGTGRPVHSTLLGAEIPIVEHLARLDRLPDRGFRFTAVPPKIRGAGAFTVRAYATVAE